MTAAWLHVLSSPWTSNQGLSISAILLSMLLAWRLWNFSLKPYLYPNSPKELPYWIPFIGHGWSFLTSMNSVLDSGKKYFPGRETYALKVFGETIYITSAPSDITEVYRNTGNIDVPETARNLYIWNGLSTANVKKLWDPPSAEKKGLNSRIKAPNAMILDFHWQQLSSGANFDDMMDNHIVLDLQNALRWEALRRHSACLRNSENSISISLHDWCAESFISNLIRAYCGVKVHEINPNLLNANLIWEHTSWKFLYQLPWPFNRDMNRARHQINMTLTAYLDLPKLDRLDANHFVTSVEDEMRATGLSNSEIAAVLMLHFWAITGNNYKVAFWIAAHLVHDPALLARIIAETKPAVVDDNVDAKYLMDKCPLLDSLFNEIMRVYVASAILREIKAPINIGGKILQKGKKLLVPFRQLHFNEDVWGTNADDFDAERFLHGSDLTKSPSYRPFGGGSTICPGRKMARRTVYTFIALLFTQYEVKLDETKPGRFPRIDETKPPLGTLDPFIGDDVILLLSRKH